MDKRLNIRISDDDFLKLREIRDLLGLSTDSDTIRALVRMQHTEARTALRRLKKARKANET